MCLCIVLSLAVVYFSILSVFFFFNDTPTTEIYTLSLHDALPISQNQRYGSSHIGATAKDISNVVTDAASGVVDIRNILCSSRSEERFSRNAETDLVCRLLLEKKKKPKEIYIDEYQTEN